MDYSLIKKLSEEKGISLKSLAESIKMTEQGMHAAFRNQTLTVAKLESIAQALQVDVKIFFSDFALENSGKQADLTDEVEKLRSAVKELEQLIKGNKKQ